MTNDSGKVVLDIPRDRNGTFDPRLIAKYQRHFPEFDRKIVSIYARGMTTREIQGHIEEIYGFEASPSLISVITDAVIEFKLVRTSGSNDPGDRLKAQNVTAWSETPAGTVLSGHSSGKQRPTLFSDPPHFPAMRLLPS